MKSMIFFAFLLMIVQITFAQTSPKSVSAPSGAVDKIDCNAPTKEITCAIGQTKRVYFDKENNVCKLIEKKGTCAGNPQNQFTTISSCKYKCIIPNNKKNTTPKA